MKEKFITGKRINLTNWVKDSTYINSNDIERLRKIKRWDDQEWKSFPDVGMYQETGLTREITNGASNAIWLKLCPGESFDPHQHPNASHIMVVYSGKADLYFEHEGKIYNTTMNVGDTPYAVTPNEKHAVSANHGVEAIILVLNAPSEHLENHNYALPVKR